MNRAYLLRPEVPVRVALVAVGIWYPLSVHSRESHTAMCADRGSEVIIEACIPYRKGVERVRCTLE